MIKIAEGPVVQSRFTLLTYNVHEAVGRDKHKNYFRIVEVIREINPDVITLQEVDSDSGEPGENNADGASFMYETIEQSLAYHGVKGITMFRKRSAYGNAIFAAKRPENVLRHDISHKHREPRGVLECTIGIDGRPVRILNTHLGLSKKERHHQLNAVVQLLQQQDKNIPVVLAGDFNEWNPFARNLDRLKNTLHMVPLHRTFPSRLPIISLDRIFYCGGITLTGHHVQASRLGRTASDHRPLVATFTFRLPENKG
jgi:endonuclease/exonuclease/phosphatase family metal-dependent hydrolase